MALAPLAPIEKLTGLLPVSLSDDDRTRAGLVLESVSNLIRAEAGQTWETTAVPPEIETITLGVAQRVFLNPHSATSMNVTTGPFGHQVTWSDPDAVGFFLSPNETTKVRRYRSTSRGLWSLSTSREDPGTLTGFVPTEHGPPFPWYGDDVNL